MTLKVGQISNTQAVVDFIKKRFPGVELAESHAAQLKFKLPPNIKRLSDVFACVIDVMKAFKIDDYTLSQTTLEELFVDIASQQTVQSKGKKSAKKK